MKAGIVRLCLIGVLVLLLGSCTRNDGDIGQLFGMWRVTSIEKNGTLNADYDGTMYFLFQSSVYCQKKVNEQTNGYDDRMALWRYEGEGVVITFSDFLPLSITGMARGDNYVNIDECTGDAMTMSYGSVEGDIFVYKMKKW